MSVERGAKVEIVRLRVDHGTIYVRLPVRWRVANGLKYGGHVVVSEDADGSLRIDTLDDGIKNAKRIAGN